MKKLLAFAVSAAAVISLSSPVAFAAEGATKPSAKVHVNQTVQLPSQDELVKLLEKALNESQAKTKPSEHLAQKKEEQDKKVDWISSMEGKGSGDSEPDWGEGHPGEILSPPPRPRPGPFDPVYAYAKLDPNVDLAGKNSKPKTLGMDFICDPSCGDVPEPEPRPDPTPRDPSGEPILEPPGGWWHCTATSCYASFNPKDLATLDLKKPEVKLEKVQTFKTEGAKEYKNRPTLFKTK